LLTTTPLQVTILALIIASGGTPPRQREALFNKYLEVIYERETAKGRHIIQSEKELLIGLHKFIGYISQEKATRAEAVSSLLDARTYEAQVGEYLNFHDPYSPREARRAALHAITREAGERLVLIIEPVVGEFGFELRSIQEFFAACHLVDTADSTEQRYQRFEAVSTLPHWRNVALFFAGRVGRSFAGEVFHVVEVCRAVDREAPDRFVRRGSRLALELAADQALTPNRRAQRSLIEHGLELFDLRLAHSRRFEACRLLERLPQEDIRDHVLPILNRKAAVLDPGRLDNLAHAAHGLSSPGLVEKVIRRMADSTKVDRRRAFRTMIDLGPSTFLPDEQFVSVALSVPIEELVEVLGSATISIRNAALAHLFRSHMSDDLMRVLVAGLVERDGVAVSPANGPMRVLSDLVSRPWPGDVLQQVPFALAGIRLIRGLTLNERRRQSRMRTTDDVLKRGGIAERIPEGVVKGEIGGCLTGDEVDCLIAGPMWLMHLLVGDVTVETLATFGEYYRAASRYPSVRRFFELHGRTGMVPVFDVIRARGLAGIVATADLVEFAGSRGSDLWSSKIDEIENIVGEDAARSRETAGASDMVTMRFSRRVKIAEAAARERFPSDLAEYAVRELFPAHRLNSHDLELVQRLRADWLLTRPRIWAIIRLFSNRARLNNSEESDVNLLVEVLDRFGDNLPEYFAALVTAWLANLDEPPGEVLSTTLRRLARLPTDSGTLDVDLSHAMGPTGVRRLIMMACDSTSDEYVSRGAALILSDYAISYNLQDRGERLPQLRFRGLAELHRTIFASSSSVVRDAGLRLFLVRLPSSDADFDLIGNAVTHGSCPDLPRVFAQIVRRSQDYAPTRERWRRLFEHLFSVSLQPAIEAVVGDAFERFLASDDQSLAQRERALGLPMPTTADFPQ